jgi:hypothetical protein
MQLKRSGIGPHFESPAWIINQPLNLGLVNFDEKLLNEFVTLWKANADEFLSSNLPEVKSFNFFECLCMEECFLKSETLETIKSLLLK